MKKVGSGSMAKLYFHYGAMNSGKSTILMQVAFNYEERNMKVLLWKPKLDTKGEDHLESRIGLKRKVDHLIEDGENLVHYFKSLPNYKEISCILVDEAQFLEPEQVDQLLEITSFLDVPVMCYGLRTDFRMEGFRGSPRLLLLAHDIKEIKTICSCGRKATHQMRFVGDTPTFQGDQVAIDGKKKVHYESFCSKCYLKMRKKVDREKTKKV